VGAPGARQGGERLLVIGASARAAAQSARRAGFAVYWLDLFGDRDLRATGPGEVLAGGGFPRALDPRLRAAAGAAAAFLYTGALENRPGLVAALAAVLPLLGNGAAVLRAVRDPWRLAACWQRAGIDSPALARPGQVTAGDRRWLVKPLAGAAGLDIGADPTAAVPGRHYLQEYVRGPTESAVFLGTGGRCRLLGTSAALTGDPRFGGTGYRYCGSLTAAGAPPLGASWQRLGDAVQADFALQGLFGIDAVIAGGQPVPLEVNPRYTASVEVLERACRATAIDRHVAACRGRDPMAWPPAQRAAGKAVLYARRALGFHGPAVAAAVRAAGCEAADIPAEGSRIEAGRPILSLLAAGSTAAAVERRLAGAAMAVYAALEAGGPGAPP